MFPSSQFAKMAGDRATFAPMDAGPCDPNEESNDAGTWDVPDTDSEFGDYTAVRATWRRTAGAAPGKPADAPPGGFSAAPGAPQAQPRDAPAAAQGRRCRGRKARVSQTNMVKMVSGTKDLQSVTTVMVRNLPVSCNQCELVHELDRSGFEDTYDFCYMPCDFVSSNNKGYAFVNFLSTTVASCFKKMWHGSYRFPNHPNSRNLQVTAAHIQGHDANMAMVLQTVGSIRNPNFRRLVFSKTNAERPGACEAAPAARPATGPPAAPSRLGGRSEEAGPQTTPIRPPAPGMLYSVCVGALPQVCVQQPTPAGWPAVRGTAPYAQGTYTALATQPGWRALSGQAVGRWGYLAR